MQRGCTYIEGTPSGTKHTSGYDALTGGQLCTQVGRGGVGVTPPPHKQVWGTVQDEGGKPLVLDARVNKGILP